MTMAEFIIDALMTTSATSIGLFVGRRLGKKAPPGQGLCTGFVMSDGRRGRGCKSFRYASCSDGRCSYHCKKMCKCDEIFK